ncbi:hypothetical protein FQN57_005885 [Myotisia sp. PD_48]|nr:hypothetical protein FQN57_005885 [Myotisia sp. PD_48]
MSSASGNGLSAKNILLFGATGLIGKHILNAILENRSHFNRIAIFTSAPLIDRRKHVESLKERGVEVIIGDIKNEKDIISAYEGIDTVISALGRTVLADQISLIKLAAESPSVKWFFPSEYGTDIEYGPESANEKPHQRKLQVRATLKDIQGLNYTYVVTGPFADGYVGLGPAGARGGAFIVQQKLANLLGDGRGRVSLTTMADVGKLVVAALLHPEISKNRALKVNSFTTTPAEILAEFERQTGGDKWSVTYTPIDELRKLEEEAWSTGNLMATVYTLRRIWTEGGTLYEKRDNEAIDAPPMETLQDVVSLAIKAQPGLVQYNQL